jgi:hypothetical protein
MINVHTYIASLQTANQPQPLLLDTAYNFITIYNKNNDTIYIGDASAQPIPILASGSYSIDIHNIPLNLASIYWVSSTAGDVIEVLYS